MQTEKEAKKLFGSLGKQIHIDIFLASICWLGAFLFSNITIVTVRSTFESAIFSLVAVIATITMMRRKGLYQKAPSLPKTDEIAKVFVAVVTGAAAVTIFAAFANLPIGATEIILGSIVLFQLRTLVRALLTSIRSEVSSDISHKQKVTVVGAGREAKELTNLILDHPESQLHFCGVVGSLAVSERNGLADYWIGPTSRLIEIMKRYDIGSAIVTTTGFRGDRFQGITQELFEAGFDVHLTTGISRMREGRFEVKSLVHEPFISVARNKTSLWQKKAKRVLDIVGALVGLVLFFPFILISALAILIEDGRPIFYTSKRVARKGTEFDMYKFRSMVTEADLMKKEMEDQNERNGPLFKLSNDPRITKVGKFIRETSIDELPQLFNVLKGDMSLVGPRPALPEETQDFDEELRKRTDVRPGITGLWQVEARSNEAFNAYRRLDLHYVENWTFWLDLRILLATAEQMAVSLFLLPIRKFLKRKSSNTDSIRGRESYSTLPPFMISDAPNAADIIDLREPGHDYLQAAKTITEEI